MFLKLANHQIHQKKSITAIAETRILAHLKEIVMRGTLSTRQRSSLRSQKKPTSDFVTKHLKNVTETTHALSQTNGTKM